jgi:hypothetical protein
MEQVQLLIDRVANIRFGSRVDISCWRGVAIAALPR